MGILQYFDQFYEKILLDVAEPTMGDIWYVPIPDTNEVPRILDVVRATPDEHDITTFEIVDIAKHHFTKRERLPIKRLALGHTEELIIAKGKCRPVVILAKSIIDNVKEIKDPSHQRMAAKLGTSYLIAPMYSVSTMSHATTFGPELVARIRAMHYPHLFCLPSEKDKSIPESIVRLDRVCSSFLKKGCTFAKRRLHEEPLSILISQFSALIGGEGIEEFQLVKELVCESYPV